MFFYYFKIFLLLFFLILKKNLVFFKLSLFARVMYRIFATFSLLLSLLIIYGEVVMFININQPNINISPLSLLLHINSLYFWVDILFFLLMTYMCFCAISVLVKIRLFNYYHLVRSLSDPPSLLFFACYLSMIITPLSSNILVFVNAYSENTTVYARVFELFYCVYYYVFLYILELI
jgi:hypothetical protein